MDNPAVPWTTAPPTIVLFVNHPSLFDATYQRYLLNTFREKLPFHDIPIKLYLRSRTQSDPNRERADSDPTEDEGPKLEWPLAGIKPDSDTGNYRQLDREVNEALSELED